MAPMLNPHFKNTFFLAQSAPSAILQIRKQTNKFPLDFYLPLLLANKVAVRPKCRHAVNGLVTSYPHISLL